MKRSEFEHALRAAANIVKDDLVVIGSQALLAQYPNAPDALLTSLEVDVYPRTEPERAIEIDGAIGDSSRFAQTYGYYVRGVGPETLVAPAGWEDRLVRLDLAAIRPREGSITAWCLESHDLVLAKLAAGRPHDLEYVEEVLRCALVDVEQLRLGLELMPMSHRAITGERLEGLLARLSR